MSDERLRALEREASSGDARAMAALAAERFRVGVCPRGCGGPGEEGGCCCVRCYLEVAKAGSYDREFRCPGCPNPEAKLVDRVNEVRVREGHMPFCPGCKEESEYSCGTRSRLEGLPSRSYHCPKRDRERTGSAERYPGGIACNSHFRVPQ